MKLVLIFLLFYFLGFILGVIGVKFADHKTNIGSLKVEDSGERTYLYLELQTDVSKLQDNKQVVMTVDKTIRNLDKEFFGV